MHGTILFRLYLKSNFGSINFIYQYNCVLNLCPVILRTDSQKCKVKVHAWFKKQTVITFKCLEDLR